MSRLSTDERTFYSLGFASQMIVWATRKRLHLLARGASEDNVLEVFGRAGLDDLHAALMVILDVLLCGASNRVQLHAVACAGLAAHEVDLLNALAYRQQHDLPRSERYLQRLLSATGARLAEPAVAAVVNELDAFGLRLTVLAEHDDLRTLALGSVAIH